MNTDAELANEKLTSDLKAVVRDAEGLMKATAGQAGEKVSEARSRLAGIALACGGLAGPLFYVLTPQWSVLVAGFAGGTLAFMLNKSLERKRV